MIIYYWYNDQESILFWMSTYCFILLHVPWAAYIVHIFKWAILGLFCLFSSFQKNITILTTNICEKMLWLSSKWRRDSNPRPLEPESPPITTWLGLPPNLSILFVQRITCTLGPVPEILFLGNLFLTICL